MARRDDTSTPKGWVDARKVRSPFGTRVARAITCSACGAADTIHFAPRPEQPVLCRRCAAERLGVVDRDANIVPERRERCGRCELYVARPCAFEDPLDCPEHARALALRQGDRTRGATESRTGVLRVRRSDTD